MNQSDVKNIFKLFTAQTLLNGELLRGVLTSSTNESSFQHQSIVSNITPLTVAMMLMTLSPTKNPSVTIISNYFLNGAF